MNYYLSVSRGGGTALSTGSSARESSVWAGSAQCAGDAPGGALQMQEHRQGCGTNNILNPLEVKTSYRRHSHKFSVKIHMENLYLILFLSFFSFTGQTATNI